MNRRAVIAFLCGVVCLPALFYSANIATAQQSEVERLQSEISQKNSRLAEIEKEIAEYTSALNEVGAEKKTLQSAINQLDLERKKVQADISYTENKISSTELTINKLNIEIDRTKNDIASNQDAMRSIIRAVDVTDDETMIERLLRNDSLSEFWNELENLETVKESIRQHVEQLTALKSGLESKRSLTTAEKEQLSKLMRQYDDQSSILKDNLNEKSELLDVTKNKESNYQSLLSQKEAAREKLQAEVRDIESQLQFILDPTTIPTPGTPVLKWPIANPYITQYFGYTKFAQSGAYGGNQHNGMDLGTPIGTQIHAPLMGTVRNIGNTDAVPGCYSWGKWVLIDHPNGLSSMFAHLSQIAVSPGQQVQTGDIVGYTGNTGYSTGPHLHYTLYVQDAVNVMAFNQFKTVTGCGAALSPFAAVEGYLDPLDYLPPL